MAKSLVAFVRLQVADRQQYAIQLADPKLLPHFFGIPSPSGNAVRNHNQVRLVYAQVMGKLSP